MRGTALAYYPAFLDLRGRRCVVVGGGEVARQKVRGLLPCGAGIVVVAPAVHGDLLRLADRHALTWVGRPYREADLDGAFLAIAATDDGAVNGRVAEDARRRRILCNVVDAPEHCDFIAPAVVRRGPLVAALSTGGGSPALASRLARDLTAAWGPEYGQLVLAMRSLRPLVRRLLPDARRRKTYWLAVAARDDLLALGRRGGRNAVRAALLEALARHADPA